MEQQANYTGPEHRVEQRRKLADRRQSIRFELDKTPRRSGKDRRTAGKTIWDGREGF